ncbi:putative reverse transcriptase domain-containing protein, partial [Tanacetum coccineum]
HPQADGQSERMIQTLEDTLRACVTDFGGSYQLRIRCAPFEALYGRKCRSPVIWAEIGGSSLIGPELVQETTDKVVLIKEKLKAARDRQKSLVIIDANRWSLRAMYRIGPVAYRLRLPEELSGVHDTFHVSNLKKCLADASLHVPLDEIKVDKTLRFVEEPVENSDCEVMRLKCSRMVIVKVRFWLEARSLRLQAKLLAVRYLVKVSWNSKCNFELTWVWEDYLKDKYPRLIVFVLVFVEAAKQSECKVEQAADQARIERDNGKNKADANKQFAEILQLLKTQQSATTAATTTIPPPLHTQPLQPYPTMLLEHPNTTTTSLPPTFALT